MSVGYNGLRGMGFLRRRRAGAPGLARLPDPRRLLTVSALAIFLLAASALTSIFYSVQSVDTASVRSEMLRAEVALRTVTDGRAPDAGLAARLAREYQLQASRFAKVEEPLPVGEVAIPVPDAPGTVLAWAPRRFASEAFMQLVPIRVLTCFLLLGGIGLVLVRQYRLAVELDAQRRAIAELAAHDTLTGLGNRMAFDERLKQAGAGTALFYIDLDGFKQVNDRHGHGAGDALLRIVGARLVAAAGPEDFAARIGGDEFALLRPSSTSREELAELASDLAAVLSEPAPIGGGVTVDIVASIGIAVAEGRSADGRRLVRAADAALYRAKALPGHSFAFADSTDLANAA